ncbi:hypothetical protein M431DRAFT_420135 [Trichoderma harzianum CBS 226.95]|uniref:Uncharacterized protein n=1 Tax=Trichoderma harzianum CBS 226.95 TaxID=983964 RepID=A0A2T4AGH9_TRIHA|nr:hypothetical protein M431DRAFT_420135 [Trichoderma harzianum CBS 226.95]PTB56189.1 hypothetical protein M431DRAFT_420135 [Trichoderma harzianum CBS 226.95]
MAGLHRTRCLHATCRRNLESFCVVFIYSLVSVFIPVSLTTHNMYYYCIEASKTKYFWHGSQW